ncbi:MYG1_protein [Hexamita inflata]|uniref:MYG1 protein n=1 Tax=Hexamita inflata TaxID=28002 RepID=A0AA86UVD9_9EUKA|nr:MYG1 protein [Hexamita inflata]
MNIVTHSNDFHADDCLSTFFLKQIFDVTSVVRSRDEEVIKQADIAYDVGGIYDKAALRFDHHQLGFNEFFPNSTVPLSSAGVIYRDFGREILLKLQPDLTQEQLDFMYNFVYFQFVQAIDGNDNGVDAVESAQINYVTHTTSLPSRVHRCNHISDFDAAVQMCTADFTQFVSYIQKKVLPQVQLLKSAFESRFLVHNSGRVIKFSGSVSAELLNEFERQFETDILFTVLEKDNQFRVVCVNQKDSFKLKQGLPEEWRGLRGEVLSQRSGISGGVFVHKSGFMGVWETESSAMQALEKAMQ